MDRLWELNIIEWLQKGESTLLNYFFYAITQLGSEIVFFVVACILFWCVNKRDGLKFMLVFLLGSAFIESLKNGFKLTRPYDHPSGRAKSIFSKTEGYTFPSGHSHAAMNVGTQISIYLKRGEKQRAASGLSTGRIPTNLYIVIIYFLAVLVMLSRMYLGQHYLLDVLVGGALGVAAAFGAAFIFELFKDNEELFALGLSLAALIVFILLGGKHLGNASGALGGVALGYLVEKRLVRYDVRASTWAQVVKVCLGLIVALGLKEGLKPLFGLSGHIVFEYIRYFIVGVWGSLGAPFFFKLTEKFYKKESEKKRA